MIKLCPDCTTHPPQVPQQQQHHGDFAEGVEHNDQVERYVRRPKPRRIRRALYVRICSFLGVDLLNLLFCWAWRSVVWTRFDTVDWAFLIITYAEATSFARTRHGDVAYSRRSFILGVARRMWLFDNSISGPLPEEWSAMTNMCFMCVRRGPARQSRRALFCLTRSRWFGCTHTCFLGPVGDNEDDLLLRRK